MLFISFGLILFFFYGFYYNFSKKLVLLLLFESVYICLIYIGLTFSMSCALSSNFLVYMMVFMVLDSVFGICLLVSCVRNSSLISWNFYNL